MLDEHVVACVAALCLYAAQDDAPDEARARLVRKFLEKDQEKLKSYGDKAAAARAAAAASSRASTSPCARGACCC